MTPSNQRYHGLDALRAGAMLLGLVLHASQFYLNPAQMPLIVPWVTTPAPHATDLTGMVSIWIHLWRMPVFFLLAGFFAQMTLERRGMRVFWQDRALRIFAVMVLAHLAIVIVLGRPLGSVAHLWFLWLLTFYCALAPLSGRLVSGAVFARAPRALWCVLPVTVAGLLARDNVWHDLPGRFWDPAWRAFVLYGVFFVLGQSLWKSRDFLEVLRGRVHIAGLLAVGLICHLTLGAVYYTPIPEALRQLLVALATLGWGFGLIGLTHRWMQRPHRLVAFGVEVSYAVYLFHLYIVYHLSALTIEAGWHQYLAIPAVSVLGFGASLLCYLVLVRWTPLNWLLAGYHKSWLRWPWAERRWGWRHS